MKKLIILFFSSMLVLGACGQKEENSTSETKNKNSDSSKLTFEEQDKIYKKEIKKLSKSINEFSDSFIEGYNEGKNSSDSDDEMDIDFNNSEIKKEFQSLYSVVNRYTDKTKNLNDIDKSVGDNAAKTFKVMLILTERIYELEEFKKENPDKETSYDISTFDAFLTTTATLQSLSFEYDKIDADLKNQELGTKGNESVTNLMSIHNDFDHMDTSEVLGIFVSEFNDTLSTKNIKDLSNEEFREKNNKIMVTETPDISKLEYNSLIDDINENSPEFLHYEHSNKMVSTTEYNNIMDIRNGIVAPDDSSYSEDSKQDTSLDEDETVTRENVMDYVEDYEGETLDTDSYTFKEPEHRDDGSWGFAYYTKDGELAGSYIVDEYGMVSKFDEDGIEE
ncbi:hypothetical protein BUY93_06365 [Mammaliicoccus fleurettii]|nr:hypothetical protein BUY93_06365 [Mammaliicoccus fleurettii]